MGETPCHARQLRGSSPGIPHICHFFYTGRIFESQTFTPKNYKIHPKITTNTPKKRKYALFLHFILKNLHLTYFFTRAPPVVPVTNMRYVLELVHLGQLVAVQPF